MLGMVWDGMLFVDITLLFGLRSAPKIFNALANVVEWIAQQRGVRCIPHYLDDFLVMGSPDTYECQEAVHTLTGVLGLPLAEDKLEGPATKLTFLGFEIDCKDGATPPTRKAIQDPNAIGGIGHLL